MACDEVAESSRLKPLSMTGDGGTLVGYVRSMMGSGGRACVGSMLFAVLVACGDGATATGGAQGATTSGGATSSGATAVTAPTEAGSGESDGAPTSEGGVACGAEACVADACRTPVGCEDGACVWTFVPEGTVIDEQVSGDCRRAVCDGQGAVVEEADASDVEDDGVECTLDACEGTTPQHTPGMTACYSGPPGTAGVGACAAGVQQCDTSGPVGPCVGEVLPTAEQCDGDGADEDCDGASDDGDCSCAPGEQQACYSGPDGTQGVGTCAAGTQTCGEAGWGPCEGDVTPAQEACAGGLDEDCDGAVDECVCGDGVQSPGEACDDGNMSDDDACSSSCTLQIVESMALGQTHSCAQLSDGRVKCWGIEHFADGYDKNGGYNYGDAPGEMGAALPAVPLGAGVKVAALRGTSFSTVCALLVGGKVKCWGSGGPETGLGNPPDYINQLAELGDTLQPVNLGPGAVAVGVDVGYNEACAILAGGALKCWGANFYGMLLKGDNKGITNSSQFGAALPAVNVGAGYTVVDITMGAHFMCALLEPNAVKCWGRNQYGQLGLGDTLDRGDQPEEVGDGLPVVDLGAGVVVERLVASTGHTCALLQGGALKCWGTNSSGQLGLGDTEHRGDERGEMGDALPAVDLGAGEVADVAAMSYHTCVVLTNGKLKCWGGPIASGLGDPYLGDDPEDMGDALPEVPLGMPVAAVPMRGIFATQMCARLVDGSLKCWRENGHGQLGIGDTKDRSSLAQLGDALPTVKLFTDAW